MKGLKRMLLMSLMLLSLLGSNLAYAEEENYNSIKIKDAGAFSVREILSVDSDITTNKGGESLTADLIEKAAQENTSPVGALLLRAINLLTLIIGTFAVIMIIIGGFMFASSNGDESKIDRGKALITQALSGLVIAFLSYYIVVFIGSFLF